jgi:hypothetical protein
MAPTLMRLVRNAGRLGRHDPRAPALSDLEVEDAVRERLYGTLTRLEITPASYGANVDPRRSPH